MITEKLLDTDVGKVVHVSRDGVRFYPKDMVEELACMHDKSVEKVLKEIEEYGK